MLCLLEDFYGVKRHTLLTITTDVLAEVAQVMGQRDERENHNPLFESTHQRIREEQKSQELV